jgi:hypothetical protein
MTSDQRNPGPDKRYEFDIPLGEVRSDAILALDAYWRSKRRGDFLPARGDIVPWEITRLLPDLVLLDVERDPFRCRIRLVGTRAAERRGDNTGRYLDQVPTLDAGRSAEYVAEMRLVCEQRRPAFARDWLTLRYGTERDIYAGIWPLAADGQNVNMLIVMEDWAQVTPGDLAPLGG